MVKGKLLEIKNKTNVFIIRVKKLYKNKVQLEITYNHKGNTYKKYKSIPIHLATIIIDTLQKQKDKINTLNDIFKIIKNVCKNYVRICVFYTNNIEYSKYEPKDIKGKKISKFLVKYGEPIDITSLLHSYTEQKYLKKAKIYLTIYNDHFIITIVTSNKIYKQYKPIHKSQKRKLFDSCDLCLQISQGNVWTAIQLFSK